MPYSRQTWTDAPSITTPLEASRLNHIEEGVEYAYAGAEGMYAALLAHLGSPTAHSLDASAIVSGTIDAARLPATGGAVPDVTYGRYVRLAAQGGNDANDGKAPNKPKATIAAALASIPTAGVGTDQDSQPGYLWLGEGIHDLATEQFIPRDIIIEGTGPMGARGSNQFDTMGTTIRRTGNVTLFNTGEHGGRVITDALTDGTATLTSATAAFVAGDVGRRLRIRGRDLTVRVILSATSITVGNLNNTAAATVANSFGVSQRAVIGGFEDWSHGVQFRNLNFDGNRSAFPSFNPLIRTKRMGFDARFDRVAARESSGPVLYADDRNVNLHTIGLTFSYCGNDSAAATIDPTTNTITLANHGLRDGDLFMIRAPRDVTTIVPDRLYYAVDCTTNGFRPALTRGATRIDIDGTAGSITIEVPGGIVVENTTGTAGAHVTIREAQIDDIQIAPIIIIDGAASRNNKFEFEGKFENKDGAQTTGVTIDRATGTFTKANHNRQNGNVIQLVDLVNITAGLPGHTRLYVVDRTTNTFRVALTLGGAAITGFTGAGAATCTMQVGGGGVNCNRDICLLDQRDTVNAGSLIVGLVTAQVDGVVSAEPIWTARRHAIVRLTDCETTSGASPNHLIDMHAMPGGNGYDAYIIDDNNGAAEVGNAESDYGRILYRGGATAAVPLIEFVNGVERLTYAAASGTAPTRASPDGSSAVNVNGATAATLFYRRIAGAWVGG